MRFPRLFKVRMVTVFDVMAYGPKTAVQIVVDNLREKNIELDELEFKAEDTSKTKKQKWVPATELPEVGPGL